MSQARRTFLRLSLLSTGLLSSGLVMAQATIDPLLTQHMKKARAAQGLQVVVSYKQSGPVTAEQVNALKALGIKKGVTMSHLPIAGVVATPAQVRELAKRKDVVSVFYNARLRYFNAETNQLSGSYRVHTRPGDFGRALPYSGRGVTVVVNDSGVDTTHPDLPMGSKVQDNVFAPQNILHNVNGIVPYAVVKGLPNTDLGSGHGNHVAGTVAGTGVAYQAGKNRGAAPGADLVGYGSGGVLLILDAVGGLNYALANQKAYRHPVRVVTNSWGSSGKFNENNPVNIASYELYKNNIVVTFAAGNDGPGEDTHNPYAQAPWVISVGAGEKDGVLTSFSSRGNRGESREFTMPDGVKWTYKNEPTVVATGVDIISTRTITGGVLALSAPGDAGLQPAEAAYYSFLSGTSMATPHVAGVVALMMEANPKLTPKAVKEILVATATNMSGRQPFEVGAGHLNAYAAVAMAAGLNKGYGSTLTLPRAFAAVGPTPGAVDTLLNPPDAIQLPGSVPEFPFTVTKDHIEIIGKVDTYSASNGQGLSMVMVELVEPDGTTVHQGDATLPGAGQLGNVSMVTLANPTPGDWKLRIKGFAADQVFTPEEMQVSVTGRRAGKASPPKDLASLSAAAKTVVDEALKARVIDVDADGNFNGDRELNRFELAQYLTWSATLRQSLPLRNISSSKFTDVPTTDARYGTLEAVTSRGGILRDKAFTQDPLMLHTANTAFNGSAKASREELAYALVQSLGDQATTTAIELPAGNIVTADNKQVADTDSINAKYRKHVKRALDLGLITLRENGGKFFFEPSGSVSKLQFADSATKMTMEYRKAEDQ